jgi:hypothetical protein
MQKKKKKDEEKCSAYVTKRRKIKDLKAVTRAGDVARVIEHLPSMIKTLGSIPSTAKI